MFNNCTVYQEMFFIAYDGTFVTQSPVGVFLCFKIATTLYLIWELARGNNFTIMALNILVGKITHAFAKRWMCPSVSPRLPILKLTISCTISWTRIEIVHCKYLSQTCQYDVFDSVYSNKKQKIFYHLQGSIVENLVQVLFF